MADGVTCYFSEIFIISYHLLDDFSLWVSENWEHLYENIIYYIFKRNHFFGFLYYRFVSL